MSLTVDVSINGTQIHRIIVDNLTARPSGENTYRWTCADLTVGPARGLLSAQQGRLTHVMEDGALALIAKVAQAAADSTSADPADARRMGGDQ